MAISRRGLFIAGVIRPLGLRSVILHHLIREGKSRLKADWFSPAGLLSCVCGPHVPLARYDFLYAFHVTLSNLADLHINNGTRGLQYVPLSILEATMSMFVPPLKV